jgi:hypothetical protein
MTVENGEDKTSLVLFMSGTITSFNDLWIAEKISTDPEGPCRFPRLASLPTVLSHEVRDEVLSPLGETF